MKKVVLSLAFVAAVLVSCKDQAAEATTEAPVMEEAVEATAETVDSTTATADSTAAPAADAAATDAAAHTEEVKK
ncbi:hypothetical protein NAT51_04670 [Flavobacterium amniphilum]|uniref:hypothetical protein n=1 Tax=Flavobacterium amniphilum TaxID=1834035 RepID=UPI00202A2353|nr:hypothetical protein [Flavobacterium amniphilum]MCL9804801.1 hypothetical protein [Flavobacterium amniphilum]